MPDAGIQFEKELNAEQLAAVQAPDGPVLVIAAAGTGKTRTLVYRVAYLRQRGIPADRILLLTFTNRAAREMLERAESLVGTGVGGMWGGTFHHMANRMLRRHADRLGYRLDYSILDRDDSRSLVKNCVDDLGLKDKHFPKPDVLMSLFGLSANTTRSIDDIAGEHFEHHPLVKVGDVVAVCRAYNARKRELNGMDFDDLLWNGLVLLRDHAEVRARYQEQFQHILVDEYQDTNKVQSDWVDILAGRNRNLLVVGDDFQSIYSWRGADFKNIITFPDRYPGASVFKLETNYRSVPEILDVANACIEGNPEQFQKTLRAVRNKYHKPRVVKVRDGYGQARFIIEETARLRGEGYRMKDMVVLYRSHFQAMELQLEMAKARMPYVITSGVRFFEQAHIKDVCAPLRLVANPGDELAFHRMMELFPKVGSRTVSKIWDFLGRSFHPLSAEARNRLAEKIPAGARPGWSAVSGALAEFKPESISENMAALIKKYVDVFYDEYAVETFDNYERRMEDIEELINFTGGFHRLDEMLAEMALMSNLDAEPDAQVETPAEAIRLSTIHQAKGLEWKVVFVLWLADGMFPSSRSMSDGSDSEERRLFYVATTRAEDELYLCFPECRRNHDGTFQYYSISRFLKEIPPPMMKEVVLRAW